MTLKMGPYSQAHLEKANKGARGSNWPALPRRKRPGGLGSGFRPLGLFSPRLDARYDKVKRVENAIKIYWRSVISIFGAFNQGGAQANEFTYAARILIEFRPTYQLVLHCFEDLFQTIASAPILWEAPEPSQRSPEPKSGAQATRHASPR